MTILVILLIAFCLAGYAIYVSGQDNYYCYHHYQNEPQKIEACNKEIADTKLANYTLLLVVGTFLLGVIAIVQLVFLLGADETARLTAQAALDANRPWLTVDAYTSGPIEPIGGPNYRLRFGISINNIGNSPAVDTEIIVSLICYAQDNGTSFAVPRLRGFVIFPQETIRDIVAYGGINGNQINKSFNEVKIAGHINISAIVKVKYKFIGGFGCTERHYSVAGTDCLGFINITNTPIGEGLFLEPLRHMTVAT